jgi:hypothetical protein
MVRSWDDSGYRYGVGRLAILEARSDCLRWLVRVQLALELQWGTYASGLWSRTSLAYAVCTLKGPWCSMVESQRELRRVPEARTMTSVSV